VSPACFRCQPRTVRPLALAASLHCVEPGSGCACIVRCGWPGCTGKPQPGVDRQTRAHNRKEVRD
jgi:hypothetical protein